MINLIEKETPLEFETDYWEIRRTKKMKILDIDYVIEIKQTSKSPYPQIKIQKITPTAHHSKWIEEMTFSDPFEVEMLLGKVLELYKNLEEELYMIAEEFSDKKASNGAKNEHR